MLDCKWVLIKKDQVRGYRSEWALGTMAEISPMGHHRVPFADRFMAPGGKRDSNPRHARLMQSIALTRDLTSSVKPENIPESPFHFRRRSRPASLDILPFVSEAVVTCESVFHSHDSGWGSSTPSLRSFRVTVQLITQNPKTSTTADKCC